MQCRESACDVFEQRRERAVERGMAGDNDVVTGGARMVAGGRCERGLQPPPNPVADDGIADLFRNGEAKARRAPVVRSRPLAHFDQECGRRGASAASNGEELRA